jgi:hypothetical protein
MTRKEAMRQNVQSDTLQRLGFTSDEAEQLRRISMTLHRWYERECGDETGCIERDEQTDIPYWHSATRHYLDPRDPRSRQRIADREKGAVKRLHAIIAACNIRRSDAQLDPLSPYIQTDPRGAALYILRPGDVPDGEDPASYYDRGICVY